MPVPVPVPVQWNNVYLRATPYLEKLIDTLRELKVPEDKINATVVGMKLFALESDPLELIDGLPLTIVMNPWGEDGEPVLSQGWLVAEIKTTHADLDVFHSIENGSQGASEYVTGSQGGGSRSQGNGSRSQGNGSRSQGGGSASQGNGSGSQGGGSASQGNGSGSQGGGSGSQGGGSGSQGGGSASQGGANASGSGSGSDAPAAGLSIDRVRGAVRTYQQHRFVRGNVPTERVFHKLRDIAPRGGNADELGVFLVSMNDSNAVYPVELVYDIELDGAAPKSRTVYSRANGADLYVYDDDKQLDANLRVDAHIRWDPVERRFLVRPSDDDDEFEGELKFRNRNGKIYTLMHNNLGQWYYKTDGKRNTYVMLKLANDPKVNISLTNYI